MVQVTEFEKILKEEFGCYYIEEGFAEGWEDSLEEITFGSSIRLLRSLDKDSLREFVIFLENLKDQPNNPFIETLSDVTLIDWKYDSSTWDLLENILGLIAEKLKTHLDNGNVAILG
jgi:hypothetical protein